MRLITKLSKNPYVKKESINYFSFALKRGKLISSLVKLVRGLEGRYVKSQIPEHYSDNFFIKDDLFDIQLEKNMTPYWFKLPINLVDEQSGKDLIKANIATQSVPIRANMDWKEKFSDIEDSYSLHRFGWLLHHLKKRCSLSGATLLYETIIDWIHSNPCEDGARGWDSYSISERVVNWIAFLSIIRDHIDIETKDLQIILESINYQTGYLLKHLEFRGSSTNNHIINNGRALYISGSFLRNELFKECGKEILLHESQNLFTLDGFSKEGSSHYHLLMCRTYIEALWVAKFCDDDEFYNAIYSRVKDIYQCAWFFLADDYVPFIGDVSPDSPPEFYLGLQSVADQIVGKDAIHAINDEQFVSFPESGHYRFKNENYTIYIYVNPLGYVRNDSHGHSDIGGFVLTWHGQPLFVDVGRPTYQTTSLGLYARSVRSHNSISIDGFDPCVTHALNGYAQVMIDDYFQQPPEVVINDKEYPAKLHLKYFGFQRVKKGLIINRTFNFYSNKLVVEDLIEGSGKHTVESFYQLHPDVNIDKLNSNNITLRLSDGNCIRLSHESEKNMILDVTKGITGNRPSGWYFPCYGKKTPTNTLRYSQNQNLPLKNSYTIENI